MLVLCPKKLSENWNTYKGNYINNPIAEDRLRYDVLYHKDLSREHGQSNGIDLDRLNLGNYDLVVIDESHNFRNGGEVSGEDAKENRYLKLLKKVIRAGVRTKVLMLSATPVNNKFIDLKNQLALAYEGDPKQINEKLATTKSIDEIFRQAQKAYNAWCKLPAEQRTTDALLRTLDFDFFELLDSVTIDNRNRTHPFYMVYISEEGEIICDYLNPKKLLDTMRLLCRGKSEPIMGSYAKNSIRKRMTDAKWGKSLNCSARQSTPLLMRKKRATSTACSKAAERQHCSLLFQGWMISS